MFFSFLFSFQHVHDILRCFTKVIKTSKPHWTGGYHNIPKPQQTRVYHKIAKPQPTTRETLAVSCLQANGGRGGYEHMAQQASRHVSSELPSCGCLPRVVFVALFPPPPVFTRVGDRWVILLSLSLFLPFVSASFFLGILRSLASPLLSGADYTVPRRVVHGLLFCLFFPLFLSWELRVWTSRPFSSDQSFSCILPS